MLALCLNPLSWTPALQPPALLLPGRSHAELLRCASPNMQLPNLGKIAGDTMSKVMGTDPGSMGMSEDEMSSMEDRLRAGEMTFEDFLKQVQVMQKGASVQAMLGKMGGAGMTDQQLKDGQKKLEKYGEYIKFMDDEERQNTAILIEENELARKGQKAPRMERIAAAGGTVEDIGRFVLEFKMMKTAAFKMANGESPESIKQSMLEEQAAGGTEQVLNRQQRRMAKKKTKKKPKASGGFGRR